MSQDKRNLVNYVNSAADLAESVRLEQIEGTELQPETIRALEKFLEYHMALINQLDKAGIKPVQYN